MAAGHGRRTLLFAALLVYGLIFVALSIDVLARVWTSRFQFETPIDVVVLLYFEGTRALITVAGLVVATVAYLRARQHPALGWLGLGLAFATIAYTKAAGFDAFPGAAQHDIATALIAARVPRWLLLVVFGQPEWALWLALAALLAFARLYPRPLAPDQVTRRSARPRTGTMRSVALAGTDVGALARTAAQGALARGWLDGRVWLLAGLAGAGHTAALRAGLPYAWAGAAALLVAAAPLAVLFALLRAGAAVADEAARQPLAWLRRGGAAGLALLAAAAVMTPLLPQVQVGSVLLSLAALAVAACCLMAVLRLPRAPLQAPVTRPHAGEPRLADAAPR
jgi:hypothetical protein